MKVPSYTFSVAPMMDYTDRHCRFMFRQITKHSLLYTEMITAPALVHGNSEKLLEFNQEEHPVALQLGGSKPEELAFATKLGIKFGYDEINLNMGCPSDRVSQGCFGAKLMTLPEVSKDCIKAMQDASEGTEITIKCRIAVDDANPYEMLPELLNLFSSLEIRRVIIHARKAILQGLSPKENRTIPPLDYDLVVKCKNWFPDLTLCINGGINSIEQSQELLQRGLDGVMVGRSAYHTPLAMLVEVDQRIFHSPLENDIGLIMDNLIRYVERELENGVPIRRITRHMLGLFSGINGARTWRRRLSSPQYMDNAGIHGLRETLEKLVPQRNRLFFENM
ncbi:MAG: tRNA dihydrouridine(20/20a) synthase DusA [Rhodobacteraceae bacterium]|nr:tRNA dihydrouridine(20/20a) synthase DusA [Paracoccaceae bacterium]